MRAVFLDRDGVINENRSDYVKTWEEFIFLPGAEWAVAKFVKSGFPVVVVSNQACVGKGIISWPELEQIDLNMREQILQSGGFITDSYYCLHRPDQGCECRKPRPGLLQKVARDWGIDLKQSFFVGDSVTDIQAGQAVGCKCILVLTGKGEQERERLSGLKVFPDYIAPSLWGACDWILSRGGEML